MTAWSDILTVNGKKLDPANKLEPGSNVIRSLVEALQVIAAATINFEAPDEVAGEYTTVEDRLVFGDCLLGSGQDRNFQSVDLRFDEARQEITIVVEEPDGWQPRGDGLNWQGIRYGWRLSVEPAMEWMHTRTDEEISAYFAD